ncbi:MAG: hypothetical protein QG588_1618 [Candidatus Poribacteria bacterium]|nr:hypothetical protein [Candidatus Poribacteria bacterium]
MISKSKLLDPMDLPSTVGIFCWKSEDSGILFADLVNYNLNADGDIVQPAEDMKFKIRLPKRYKNSKIETISPDKENSATLQIKDNWIVVHLSLLTIQMNFGRIMLCFGHH